ncbi:MAG: 16S rRNA (uracil(1498)-N(3))-methyltransferase, partial [Firmicutes bacterium]|nr:16S rRNA (uracil(1498)-N(3))-methyltransferase [Bacillota bacterium]
MAGRVQGSGWPPRIFVPPEQWGEADVKVRGGDVRYLTRVLRLGPGDAITVLDGQGRVFAGIIKAIGKGYVSVALTREIDRDTGPAVKVSLFQAIPKGDKMDSVIQKATELGADRIVPMVTERVIVRLEDAKAAKRVERWQRIAKEASRQCGRALVPVVEPMLSLEAALERIPPGSVSIMPWEGEEETSLRRFLHGVNPHPRRVSIFIGPEGGFGLAEVEAARAKGVSTVSLGRRILRTETAGII